jgi:membrane-associated phospholipid phosphatase
MFECIAYSMLDDTVAKWMHGHANPALTAWMRAITILGAPTFVLLTTIVLAGVLLYYREKLMAIQVGLCVPLGMLLNTILKNTFDRARPDLEPSLVPAVGFSFPSGHTAAAALLFGCVTYVAWRLLTNLRARVSVALISFMLVQLVGLTRIYLGVHYLSDVLTAQLVAILWLTGSLTALELFYRRQSGLHWPTRTADKP